MSGLNIELVGEGYVQSQSVTPNTLVIDEAPIVVNLKTPEKWFAPEQTETVEDFPQDS
jgi:penicillin-binding protein 2B